MSFWPGEKLHYAETHFKFKLPWSLLFRPWPEIFFDTPFQVVPGEIPTIWIGVRDAHRFPILVKDVEIELSRTYNGKEQSPISIRRELNISENRQFAFHPLILDKLPAGSYTATCTANIQRGSEIRRVRRWNYPGLSPQPLRFKILEETPPKAPGFVAGEMHCHTHYSSDHVEYGTFPSVFQKAAKMLGLDFVNCTDHAYDFAYTEEDYTVEALSPVPRFQSLRDEIENLPQNDMPLMLASEEVSAGNSKGENVHMTALATDCYLPGLGDCGRNWLENKPTRTIAQILSMTSAHCFAAHPFQQMGLLEKFIFRRGYWKHEDLQIGKKRSIRGIQFWNGIRDEGFTLGREFWINELGKGNFLLPIGGNDAHGDLNDTTAVSLPLISLRHSRDHVFGKVRTVVKIEKNDNAKNTNAEIEANAAKQDTSKMLTRESLHAAFSGDNCYVTDGPALWWERSDKSIQFHARSNREMGGGFRYINIYGRRKLPNGKFVRNEERLIESQIATTSHVDIDVPSSGFGYLRAECETATGRFALTSAAQVDA